jgi:hypothetical protein
VSVKRMYLYTLQIKLQILFLAACCSVVFAASFICNRRFCENEECTRLPSTELKCHPSKVVMPNSTFCGCCPSCVELLGMMIITIIMDGFSTKTISLNDLWCCALWLLLCLFYIFIFRFVFTLVLHRNWPF